MKKSPKRLNNKINRSLTAVAAVGFVLSATTGSAMAAPVTDGTAGIERSSAVVTELGLKADTESTQSLAPAVIAPVQASSSAKLSFSRSEVKTVAAPKKEEPKPAPVAEVKPAEAVAAPAATAPVAVPAPAVQAVAPAAITPVAQVATAQAAPASSKGAAILAAARAQIGVNQDCTMLVTNSLKAVGINFHDWPAGYLSLGTVVSAADAQPGDIVYYANGGSGMAHVGIFSGNGRAIHGGFNGNSTVEFSVNVGSGPVYIRVH